MKTSNYRIRILINSITTAFIFLQFSISAQEIDINAVYQSAMKAYELEDYKRAAEKFEIITDKNDFSEFSSGRLYNGACIYSLNDQADLAFELLNYLASKRYYSNLNHITTDPDLTNIHSYPQWTELIEKVEENIETLPERTRQTVKTELLKAKKILTTDNGKLWGENIWSDNILVLDYDNTIYTLKPLPDSKTMDSIIYYKEIPDNILGFSNAVQEFNGEKYAVVLSNYLDDNSETIIHELFHILQYKHVTLSGEPISYLDNFDAREWLRLEYKALKNALSGIDKQKDKSVVEKYVKDAFVFRKIRQNKYEEFSQKELEIETLEGLANYTGIVLSTNPNKYQKAIREINQRELAKTYTRPFPYATGPAYGLIFDYLKLDWKDGIDKTYNFLEIYERLYVKKSIKTNKSKLRIAQDRNNYLEIHEQEVERKIEQDKLINYYTKLLIKDPTLRVTLTSTNYGRTFNMNGTLSLNDKNTVYSGITGTASSRDDFGDFKILDGKDKLGVAGIMGIWEDNKLTFVFPLPIDVDGNLIIGEYYEIELNEGWEVTEINGKGDLEIVKKKE